MFPFDGANAFTVAGTLWHVAGHDDRANTALKSAKLALKAVLAVSPERSLSEQERLYLDRVRTVISRESAGRWGVWK